MRRPIVVLVAASIVAVIVAEGRSTAPSTAPTEIPQTTMVRGTAPALEGRWFLATSVATGGGRRSTASLWEVTRVAGQLVLTERFVKLPAGASSPGPDGWEPTAAEVEAVARGWETLPAEARPFDKVSHEIIAPDAFDDAIKKDALATGALWIVRQNVDFKPEASRPTKEIRVFAASEADEHGYRGQCLTAMFAAAPMPIPIQVPGTFRLMRVPTVTRPFWRRLLDAFRGCN